MPGSANYCMGRELLGCFWRVGSLVFLVEVKIEFSHGMLKTSPLFGSKGDKFQSKFLFTTPAHNRFLNLERRLFIGSLNAQFQRCPRPDDRRTIYATATKREVDNAAIPTNDIQ